MSERRMIQPASLGLRRRTRTRILPYPWPFPFSVEDGELFRNLPPEPPIEEEEAQGAPRGKSAKKARKSGRRVMIRSQG